MSGLLVAPPGPVWACSCAPPQSPDVALSRAAAVFTGTVTGIVDRGGFTPLDYLRRMFGLRPQGTLGAPRLVTLAVADSWKGVTETPVTVATGYGGGDCGLGFNVGGQYLVYAHGTDIGLVTNMCLRTAEVTQAPTDLAYLASLPTLAVTPAPSSLPLWGLACVALLVGLLALGASAAWVWRRRRPSPA